MKSSVASVFVLLLVTPACVAQTIAGPVLGYVWDQGSGLRPILGIPGASSLGSPVETSVALLTAEVSPRQDFALAVTESKRLLLLDLRTAPIVERPLEIELAPDRIILSPTGAAAALYYRERRAMRVLTGLPGDAIFVSGEMDLTSLPPLLTAIAISDPDPAVLVAAPGGLYALDTGNPAPRLIASAENITALAFVENSRDVLLADSRRNEVVLLRDATGAGERVLLAGERDGVSRPIAVVADGRRRAITVSARTALLLDLDGSPPVSLSCNCSISGLHRLKGSSAFRLNAPSNEPLFLLDAATAEPRIFFVPSESGGPEAPGIAVPRGRSRQ